MTLATTVLIPKPIMARELFDHVRTDLLGGTTHAVRHERTEHGESFVSFNVGLPSAVIVTFRPDGPLRAPVDPSRRFAAGGAGRQARRQHRAGQRMSNLPPGVSASDIPGNRPEDVLADEVWDALADLLERFGVSWENVPSDTLYQYADELSSLIHDHRREVDTPTENG